MPCGRLCAARGKCISFLNRSCSPILPQSSISEGLPISILEAALCGLCVVSTNVGGCAELLAAPPGAGGAGGPASFGRLVAACDAAMIAYAQLEVMAMLPSLGVAKLQQPTAVAEVELKVRACP